MVRYIMPDTHLGVSVQLGYCDTVSAGFHEIMLLCYNHVFMQCNLIKCKSLCSGGTNQQFFPSSHLQYVFSAVTKRKVKGLVQPNFRVIRGLVLSDQRDKSLRFVPVRWM